MTPSSRSPRTPSGLSDSVHHQLNMYALAASAAGVGAMALSCPSEAEIVYTPTHVVLGYGHHYKYKLDLNHDGVTDLTISNTYSNDSVRFFSLVAAQAAGGVEGIIGYVSALQRGVQIGGREHFYGSGVMAVMEVTHWRSQTNWGGKWRNVHGRYLGIMFRIKDKPHYGWARLNVTGCRNGITVALTGYAYETIPNKAIIAGKTKGPDVITVQPATLGRLALGRK